MNDRESIDRRGFLKSAAGAAALAGLVPGTRSAAAEAGGAAPRKVRVGIIGCGSVSNCYLPVMTECRFAEVVSVCDIKPERARRQAERFKVPHHYPHIDAMLAGEPFSTLR